MTFKDYTVLSSFDTIKYEFRDGLSRSEYQDYFEGIDDPNEVVLVFRSDVDDYDSRLCVEEDVYEDYYDIPVIVQPKIPTENKNKFIKHGKNSICLNNMKSDGLYKKYKNDISKLTKMIDSSNEHVRQQQGAKRKIKAEKLRKKIVNDVRKINKNKNKTKFVDTIINAIDAEDTKDPESFAYYVLNRPHVNNPYDTIRYKNKIDNNVLDAILNNLFFDFCYPFTYGGTHYLLDLHRLKEAIVKDHYHYQYIVTKKFAWLAYHDWSYYAGDCPFVSKSETEVNIDFVNENKFEPLSSDIDYAYPQMFDNLRKCSNVVEGMTDRGPELINVVDELLERKSDLIGLCDSAVTVAPVLDDIAERRTDISEMIDSASSTMKKLDEFQSFVSSLFSEFSVKCEALSLISDVLACLFSSAIGALSHKDVKYFLGGIYSIIGLISKRAIGILSFATISSWMTETKSWMEEKMTNNEAEIEMEDVMQSMMSDSSGSYTDVAEYQTKEEVGHLLFQHAEVILSACGALGAFLVTTLAQANNVSDISIKTMLDGSFANLKWMSKKMSWKDHVNMLKDLTKIVLDSIVSLCTGKTYSELQIEKKYPKLGIVIEEMEDLLTSSEIKGTLRNDPKACNVFLNNIRILREWYFCMRENRDDVLALKVDNLIRRVSKYENYAISVISGYTTTRIEPASVNFWGLPGAGKSKLAPEFMRRVFDKLIVNMEFLEHEVARCEHCYIENLPNMPPKLKLIDTEKKCNYPHAYLSSGQLFFSKNLKEEFWPDYTGQLFCFVDEVFASPDTLNNPDPYFDFLNSAINSAPYPLLMAVAEEKGSSYFRSMFVVSTSNIEWPGNIQSRNVANIPALRRRINFNCEVQLNPAYATRVPVDGTMRDFVRHAAQD
jgi:hypothetical protein